LHDGLVVYGLDGVITEFNRRAEELLWTRRKKVIGKHPKELIGRDALLENIYQLSILELDDFEVREITITNPQNRVLSITLVPLIEKEGQHIGSMRVIHDLTSERESELLKQNFVAVAGHQLRTPLTNIKWTFAAAIEGELGNMDEQLQAQLKNGLTSTNRMIDIIADLLDVSRLEEKRYDLNLVSVDVIELVKIIVDELRVIVEKKGIDINVSVPSDSLPAIIADRDRLKMALQNIIDNAVNYTPEGSVVISFAHEEKQKQSIIIRVKDTGIGIAEKDQKHLFTKFYRAKNAIRLRPEGSGLGLFIAREIITILNGKIWVDSEEGKGSTFSVMVPIKQLLRK